MIQLRKMSVHLIFISEYAMYLLHEQEELFLNDNTESDDIKISLR